ncbi:MAG: aspartate 1-decarboxylase [candidate division WOR-3 bacterium]|nr:aspartate 1-decarboxylase [candidate division WOR-3 bacterium]
MLRCLIRSKIQRLVVTDKKLKYEGSLELDSRLMRAADIVPAELVQVVNVNNGSRFETYVIAARAGSGACVLNGAAARLGEVGDEVIVMSLVWLGDAESRQHRLTRVNVDHRNRIKKSDRNSPRSG